jgi:rod shape-determining protein MreD
MKNTMFYLLTILGVLWIQMAGNYFAGASGCSANVVLIGVLYFGLSRGPLTGEMLGVVWGLLMDASTLGLIGLHAVLYAGAGYSAGTLRRQLDEKKVWTQTIFTAGISLLYVLFYFILDRIFSPAPHPVSLSLGLQPLANGVLAPVFFWLMQRWSRLWDLSPQEE